MERLPHGFSDAETGNHHQQAYTKQNRCEELKEANDEQKTAYQFHIGSIICSQAYQCLRYISTRQRGLHRLAYLVHPHIEYLVIPLEKEEYPGDQTNCAHGYCNLVWIRWLGIIGLKVKIWFIMGYDIGQYACKGLPSGRWDP